jgi:uncharacterized protein
MGMMTNAQPTSVNIVGDRRIGKSSLLYRICQSYENLVVSYNRQPTEFIVVYKHLEKFYRAYSKLAIISTSLIRQPPHIIN